MSDGDSQGSSGGLAGTLQELFIDYGTIGAILGQLQQLQDDAPTETTFVTPTSVSFGTLPAGVELGFHTTNAHTFLAASLKEMLATLGLLDEGVRLFRQGTNRTDEFTQAQLDGIHKTLDRANHISGNDSSGHHA